MTRYSDKSDIQKEWLLEFSNSLKRIAAMIDGNVDAMTTMKIESVAATHFKTAEEAVAGLVKFCGAVQSGLAEAVFEPREQYKIKSPPKAKGQDQKRK